MFSPALEVILNVAFAEAVSRVMPISRSSICSMHLLTIRRRAYPRRLRRQSARVAA